VSNPETAAPAITMAEVQSIDFLNAFNHALYRMRKSARYQTWSPERRRQHALGIAFKAALDARDGKRAHPKMLETTRDMIAMRMPSHG
jgi:hypothetical protein